MASFQLNDEEHCALRGLSYLQRCVYVFGLRPFMDFSTGLVGTHKRRISYQSLREELYVNPAPGVANTGSPSKDQIRRAINGLERAGLICIESTKRHLIVKCLLATKDNFDQKQAATKALQKKKQKNSSENSAIALDNEQSIVQEKDEKRTQAAIPPNLNKNIKSFQTLLTPIPCDYFPSHDLIDKAKEIGCPTPEGEQLLIFINHCKSRAKVSADWNAEYFKWLIKAKEFQQKIKPTQNSNSYLSQRRTASSYPKNLNSILKNCEPKAAVNSMPITFSKKASLYQGKENYEKFQALNHHFSNLGTEKCIEYLRNKKFKSAIEISCGVVV